MMLGIVLGGGREQLRPIALRAWAGRLERDKGAGPFNMLEERLGFLDVRERRAEFAQWARQAGEN